ncbi:MAG: RNA methyltransferase [Zoogloeaceae bacterium]|nr:RNA methyltransferase [Zoogloeaceae bacterium]
MTKQITSRANATFKQLRLLAHSARERRKQGRTILDGMHLVSEWTARFGPPELLAVSETGARRPEIGAWLAAHPAIAPYFFDDPLFAEISPVDTPAGILAAIAVPGPPRAAIPEHSCILLDAVQDAGNLGAILRAAAAVGIGDAFLGPGCAQAWSPRVLRAAMGAHFLLRIHEHVALDGIIDGFKGVSVATTLDAGTTLYEANLAGPVAWVFGNEGSGLAVARATRTRLAVRIPMPGRIESLNVAAAAAVCLFEEARQKAAGNVQKI